MSEGSIFSFWICAFFGIGVGIRRFNNWEISISLPFVGFCIELKKKTKDNDWFSFSNEFFS